MNAKIYIAKNAQGDLYRPRGHTMLRMHRVTYTDHEVTPCYECTG